MCLVLSLCSIDASSREGFTKCLVKCAFAVTNSLATCDDTIQEFADLCIELRICVEDLPRIEEVSTALIVIL